MLAVFLPPSATNGQKSAQVWCMRGRNWWWSFIPQNISASAICECYDECLHRPCYLVSSILVPGIEIHVVEFLAFEQNNRLSIRKRNIIVSTVFRSQQLMLRYGAIHFAIRSLSREFCGILFSTINSSNHSWEINEYEI